MFTLVNEPGETPLTRPMAFDLRWVFMQFKFFGVLPNPHAAALGRRGGKARLKKLTPERRREIAREAGLASGRVRKEKARREDSQTSRLDRAG